MSKYAIENEPTYCNYYCQLHSVYSDYEARSSELDMEVAE